MNPDLFCLNDSQCLELAEKHSTPVFVYHSGAIRDNYNRLRSALPPRVRIVYAVKANPFPPILTLLSSLGTGFDCASIGELQRVAEIRKPGVTVYFAGPGKRRAEIEFALSIGARLNAESWEDLQAVSDLAAKATALSIRIHPSFGSEAGGRIIGGSGPSAFGIDEEQMEEIVTHSRALKNVQIRGLHVFIASNQRSAENLLEIYRQVLELAKRLQELVDAPLDTIDLGGGLGVPYSDSESPLDTRKLGEGLASLLTENNWFKGDLLLEPGRYLVASSGTYLCRVIRTKESRGEHFAILEGGINHLLRPHLTDQSFPVKAIGCKGELIETTLAGPLCTSLDRLGTVLLPPLKSGDLLAFGMTGAYGFTEAMTHFLSHPLPGEILLD